jgi:hypothetical protein
MAFEIDENGNIHLSPLVGYDAAVIADVSCALRLTLARREDPPGTGSIVVQVGMSAFQARAIGQALLQMAAAVERAQPDGKPH